MPDRPAMAGYPKGRAACTCPVTAAGPWTASGSCTGYVACSRCGTRYDLRTGRVRGMRRRQRPDLIGSHVVPPSWLCVVLSGQRCPAGPDAARWTPSDLAEVA